MTSACESRFVANLRYAAHGGFRPRTCGRSDDRKALCASRAVSCRSAHSEQPAANGADAAQEDEEGGAAPGVGWVSA